MLLRIWDGPRKSGFLTAEPFKTLLRDSRVKQVLTRVIGIRKEKLGPGNHAFFRDNQASIWGKNSTHCFEFWGLFMTIVAKLYVKKRAPHP